MNKLSEQQVDKLNSAIDKVMDIMDNKPCDPNDAIVKVAQDMHLTEDYIPVIVAAYNNGTQYATREKGKTISEKTAKFNVANTDIILCKLYGNNKEAGYYTIADDNFFDFPAEVYNKEADNAKYASLMYSPCLRQKKARKNIKNVFRDEQNMVDGINSTLDTARMYKSAALDNYDNAIKDLAYYLRRVDAPSVPYAIKLASIAYGVEGTTIIKEAALRFDLPLTTKRQEPVVPITSQFYNECTKCLQKSAEYDHVCDDESKLLAGASRVLKPMVQKRANAIYKEASISNNSPKYFFEKKKSEVKQAASIFPEALASPDHGARGSKLLGSDISGLESLVRPQFRTLNPYEHNIMRSLDDPEQEAKLRDITIGANLTELMNTDEYLSDKDPEEVIDAFNELMEIAPEIHNKKPLLRAALRQYLESGGIDMQSLGVIGDVGRKAETRRDEERKLLSENVNKAIESEEKARDSAQREAQEMARYMLRQNLTVSEGRKDRMARAEEARKDRSERRKLQEAQNAYDKFKLRVETARALKEKSIDANARILGTSMNATINKARALDEYINVALDPANAYGVPRINAILQNSDAFNKLKPSTRDAVRGYYQEYAGDLDSTLFDTDGTLLPGAQVPSIDIDRFKRRMYTDNGFYKSDTVKGPDGKDITVDVSSYDIDGVRNPYYDSSLTSLDLVNASLDREKKRFNDDLAKSDAKVPDLNSLFSQN